jgi:hypothetical protein
MDLSYLKLKLLRGPLVPSARGVSHPGGAGGARGSATMLAGLALPFKARRFALNRLATDMHATSPLQHTKE